MLLAAPPPPAPSAGGTPASAGGDEDRVQFRSVDKLRRDFERYLDEKADEIEEQRDSRRMYHGAQWTPEEVRLQRERGMPATVFNKIGRKVDGIVGISEKQRQDPKAYPRNPRDENGADVATVVVREITERNEWTSKKPRALRQALIDGLSGVEFRLVKGDQGDPDIEIHTIHTEDFFYDPASVEPNFTDARFMGLSKWMDVEEAVELFPDREEEIRGLIDAGSSESIPSDRDNRWTNRGAKRLRMVEQWYISRGEWCWSFYIGSVSLDDGVSPFFDERGDTICRFEMFSALIDHDGDRYGIVRPLKPIQVTINQTVSMIRRLSLQRRLILEKGAVEDVERTRREWARPDGVVEINGGKMGSIKADDSQVQIAEHTAQLDFSCREMEAFYNINPAALAGAGHNLSGRAVNLLQAPGLAELAFLFINYRNWQIRCYRMCLNLAQRFWTAERWIRVTDDQGVAQFLQVNGLNLDEHGIPALVNYLGALDVDVIMDEGPDVQNMMQDSLDVLSQFLQALPPGSIPMDILVSLMPLPSSVKKQWTDHIEKSQQPDPAKEAAKQIALDAEKAKTGETLARTGKLQAETAKVGVDADKSHADALSALGSTAHKLHEAHMNGARVVAGGLAQIEGTPQHAAATAAQQAAQAPAGPMPAQVAPGMNAPPTHLGPALPMVPGASPGVNGALAGLPQPAPPVGAPLPGVMPAGINLLHGLSGAPPRV